MVQNFRWLFKKSSIWRARIFVMETCVLIPREFSLVLKPNDRTNCKNNAYKNDGTSVVGDVRISVWTNGFIPAGTLIYPFQGSIRFDKIDLYSLLDDNDVSILQFYSNPSTCISQLFRKVVWKITYEYSNLRNFFNMTCRKNTNFRFFFSWLIKHDN